MVIRLLPPSSLFFKATPFGLDVDLTAQDRFDPLLFGRLVEFDAAEEIAVIRDGHSGHPQVLGLVHQGVDRNGAVQK